MIFVWLAATALVLWAALWLYSRRKSETAESTGNTGVLSWLFTGIAVYAGSAMFGGIFTAAGDSGSYETRYVIGAVIGAALLFTLVQAVLNRGFKGLKRLIPAGAAMTAAAAAFAIIIVSGGLGFETRVPAAGTIDSATVDYRGIYSYAALLDPSSESITHVADERSDAYPYEYVPGETLYHYNTIDTVTLTTPEAIELVRQIHRAIVEAPEQPQGGLYGAIPYYSRNAAPRTFDYNVGGKVIKRRYNNVTVDLGELVSKLEQNAEFRQKTDPLALLAQTDGLSATQPNRAVESIRAADRLGLANSAPVTDEQTLRALVSALAEDSLKQDPAAVAAGAKPLCHLYIETGRTQWGSYPKQITAITPASFSVQVYDGWEATFAALKQAGLGEYLTAAPESGVTEIRFSEYIKSDSMLVQGQYATALLSPVADPNAYDKIESDGVVTDPGQIAELLSLAKMCGVTDEQFEKFEEDDCPPTLYLQPYAGDAQCLPMFINKADAPQWLIDAARAHFAQQRYKG